MQITDQYNRKFNNELEIKIEILFKSSGCSKNY